MHHTPWQIFVGVCFLFIIANLFIIDVKLFRDPNGLKTAAFTDKQIPSTTPTIIPNQTNLLCPNSCLTAIQTATASLQMAKTTPPSATTKTVVQVAPTLPPEIREYFVPIGTGTSASDSWVDVPGAQAMIDSGRYGTIKSVAFEAAVYVPDHNEGVWVRLFNYTDNYIVGNTELYFPDGNSSTLLTTGNVSLGSGNKIYTVQMKTQLKFPASLTNARLHIMSY